MHPSTNCAVTLVAALADLGVTDAVLCPGSRSAALAYALQDADRSGAIRLHVRVDERSAGFLALGLAKLSRRVVPVVTTSGTALANLHPAVLEAGQAGVPVLVLSADRPPELRGTGANQTTDQLHFFGHAVRLFHDLGTPSAADDPRVWRTVAARAVAAALGSLGSTAGPVHLNLPFREPLVPEAPSDAPAAAPEVSAPVVAAAPGAVPGEGAAGGSVIPDVPRTLMVLGDLPTPEHAAQAVELAGARGWPVVAEPFGRFDRNRMVAHGPLLLTASDWLDLHRPARVLVVGRPTLSRAVAQLLRDRRTDVNVVAAQPNWADPSHVATAVYPWSSIAATSAATVTSLATATGSDDGWLATWERASAALAVGVQPFIADSWPSGLGVADALLREISDAATLFVGSSNPVRDLDLAMTPTGGGSGLTVVANRGLAGIDGCVSTAAGIALSRPGRPTYALMGDLTFLHDANGLLIGPDEPRPDLTIVVVNDDGGGIFTTLEPGEHSRAGDFERIFGTPTRTSLAALCAAHHVGHTLAGSRDALAAAVGPVPQGIRVVEVPVDRASHRDLHHRLRAAAAAAVAAPA